MRDDGRLIDGVRRIAVVRANGLGDFVHSLPALSALRHAYPGAEIALLGRAMHAELLAGRPGPVERVEIVPPDAGLSGGDARDFDAHPFFARMRARRFDLALQMHGGGRHSNPFVARLGARVTVGPRAGDAPPLDRVMPYVYFQHEVVRWLELVSLVGARAVVLQPNLATTANDLLLSERVVARTRRPIAVLNPGATDPRRQWPAERFAEVGRALAGAGALVAINGDASERPLGNEVAARIGHAARNLAGRLPLPALVGLLARAAVVVSNDTGPLHLADAVGTPSVGIFWAFNVANTCPPMRARHRPFAHWDPFCPSCGADNSRMRCPHDVSFVAGVPVEPVRDAALAFLGESAGGSGRAAA